MNNNLSSLLMKILSRNKPYITHLHKLLKAYKQSKREADEQGLLQDEYNFHEGVKAIKKEIAGYVLEQKALKALLRPEEKPTVKSIYSTPEMQAWARNFGYEDYVRLQSVLTPDSSTVSEQGYQDLCAAFEDEMNGDAEFGEEI